MSQLESWIAERPDRDASQMFDRMADRLAHIPHLTVPAFVDRDDERGLRGVAAQRHESHFGRRRAPAIDHQPARKAVEIVGVGHAEDARLVDARDLVARMREARREITVVGEQQQAFGLVVEPPDRVHVFTHTPQEIDDRRAPLRIRSGRDVAARLVQEQIPMVLDDFDAASVNADVVLARLRLRPELHDGGAVHGHAPLEHQLLGRAPRRHAGLRQDLLQPLHDQHGNMKHRNAQRTTKDTKPRRTRNHEETRNHEGHETTKDTKPRRTKGRFKANRRSGD